MFSFLFAQQLNIISLPRFRHSGFSHGVAQTVHDYTLRMPVRLGQTSSPGEKRRKRSSALVHAPVAALTQRRRRISLYRRRTASLRGLQSVFAVAQPVLAGRSRCLSAPAPTIQFFFFFFLCAAASGRNNGTRQRNLVKRARSDSFDARHRDGTEAASWDELSCT